jgi:hypothetical protein
MGLSGALRVQLTAWRRSTGSSPKSSPAPNREQ